MVNNKCTIKCRGQTVHTHHLVNGEDDGAGEGEEGPVAQVDPTVGLWMVRCLLNELEKDLVDQAILAHCLVQHRLDQHHMTVVFILKKISVADPDPHPHGSGTFAWIRVLNYSSGSGSSKK